MKKLIISALCGLCLFGAFVCASAQDTESNAVAISRTAISISS